MEKGFRIASGWLDGDDTLSAEEKRLIESRLATHESGPRLRRALAGSKSAAFLAVIQSEAKNL